MEPDQETPDPERRIPLWPKTVGGMIFLGVCLLVGVGLVVIATGPWRVGVVFCGVAVLIASGARSQLGDYSSGMLRVRRKRWVDVSTLTLIGLALITLAITIPNQPG
jgi:hypothetical protein